MRDTIDILLNDQDRLQKTKDWLRSMNATTWKPGHDLVDDGELTDAACWWLQHLSSFLEFNLSRQEPAVNPWPPPPAHQRIPIFWTAPHEGELLG